MEFKIVTTSKKHVGFAQEICDQIESASKARGTGIAKRSESYIAQKIADGKAVIALKNGCFAGFCYIEAWGHEKFVANSGLVVKPEYRKSGLAKNIKQAVFELSRKKYPEAKLFGITTSLAVMKINSSLGYQPVPLSELPQDEAFWKGCQSCVNYDILKRTERKHCLCTGMVCTPNNPKPAFDFDKQSKLYSRWLRYKRHVLFRRKRKPALTKR